MMPGSPGRVRTTRYVRKATTWCEIAQILQRALSGNIAGVRGTAVVIGAGIGGLAAARSLTLHGWTVSILERAATLPTTGTTLGMWPAAMGALDIIGVGDAVRAWSGRLGGEAGIRTALRTPSGRTLVTSTGPADLCLVSRPLLLSALADGLPISFGVAVEDLGAHPAADVVVGADGAFSRTRDLMFGPPYRARALGAVAWRGTVPGTVTAYGETWAPAALFGVTPTGRDATNWYACVRSEQRFAGPQLPHLWRLFGRWHAGVDAVLGRISEEGVLHHQLVETPPLPSYVDDRAALVGDAAHAMGPFLGRGACEALVDGVVLGQCLSAASTAHEGLRRYDAARRRKTQSLVHASRLTGRFAMMGTGASARNAALGAAGRGAAVIAMLRRFAR